MRANVTRRDRQGWFGGMLGGSSEEEIETKNDMKTLQVLVAHRCFCPFRKLPNMQRLGVYKTDVCTCCADGAGEAAAGHNSVHERAREQRGHNVISAFYSFVQTADGLPPPPSFRLLHENKTLKAEIARIQKAE